MNKKGIPFVCSLLLIAAFRLFARDAAQNASGTLFVASTITAEESEEDPIELEIGYSRKVFYSVNIQDAAAAAHVLIQKIVQKTGMNVRLTTCVYDDNASILSDLRSNKLDIITVLSEDLPELIAHDAVDPFLVEVEEGGTYENFVLCARNGAAESGLDFLRGKTLTVSIWVDSELPLFWLEVLLHDKNLPAAAVFFSGIEHIRKPEQAVMRVFFRKSDACLVPKQTFSVLCEMNPQIARDMSVIETSPGFINGVLCLNKSLDETQARSLIEEKLLNMKQETGGRQMMDLFRVDDFLPYEFRYLKDTFSVLQQVRALKPPRNPLQTTQDKNP